MNKYFEKQLSMEGLRIQGNRIYTTETNNFDIERTDDRVPPKIIFFIDEKEYKFYYSNLLSDEVVLKLEEVFKTKELRDDTKVKEILEPIYGDLNIGHYVTYVFNKLDDFNEENTIIIPNSDDIRIKEFEKSFYKVFPKSYAVLNNDKVISCCVSARENDEAGEAWILTLLDYRRKGYGSTAVKLWAKDLMDNNKIPFYSHEVHNISSRKLAKSLGLKKVFEIISYE